MQLQVFGGCADPKPLATALEASRLEAVLYQDVNDPRGVGVLAMSEDPTALVGAYRDLLNSEPFAGLPLRSELTMLGRTYASGFEQDLEEWLFLRRGGPRSTRRGRGRSGTRCAGRARSGASRRRSRGRSSASTRSSGVPNGDADLAHDVRLACHGLDVHDNDFVIGLIGRELHPLSHLVQTMRKTAQTSQYLRRSVLLRRHVRWQERRAALSAGLEA